MKRPEDGELWDWLCGLAESAIRDLPEINVWQHAAQEVFLGGHSSLVHRFFDPELTPYTKIFQEAATGQFTKIHPEDWWLLDLIERRQRVAEFFGLKSSQSGFTQGAINIIVFVTRYLSGCGLYCIDSKDKAGKLCKLRLLPLLEKLCAAQMSGNADDLGTYWIEMTNWVWEMVGSYSAGVFSEKPLSHAFLDDVEYMVTEGGKRGMLDGVHIIDHARSRFTTADEHFLAVFSKPDLDDSHFVMEHRGGSQHEWHWTCPLCNAVFVPELRHLHYDKPACRTERGRYDLAAVEALTTVHCPKCEGDIEERWKGPMNAAAFYLPKSREAREVDGDPLLVPRRLSVRVNDMASPFDEVKWGRLATKLIQAEGDPVRAKFVHTNHGARPWREHQISLKGEHVRALIAGKKDDNGTVHGEALGVRPYRRGEVPFVPCAVTATADRQADKKKWTLCAWKLDGTMALIEYGATLADQDLLELCSAPRAHHGGPVVCVADETVPIFAGYGLDAGGCLIDSGFETFDVYDFCAASGWRWYPSKGVPGLSAGGYLVEGKRDFKDGREILRYNYHDYAVKVAFYKGKIELHSHPSPKARRASNVFLPSDVGDDFVVELISESLRPRKNSANRVLMDWVHDKKVGPNDWGDAMKMQLVIWQIIGPLLQQAEQQRRALAAMREAGRV